MVRRSLNLKSDAGTKTRNYIGIAFFALLFLAVLVGVFQILEPYLHAIIMAGLLASVFYPIHRWVYRRVGERKDLAAFVSVLLVALVVVVPISLFIASLVMRGAEAYQAISEWVEPIEESAASDSQAVAPGIYDAADPSADTSAAAPMPDADAASDSDAQLADGADSDSPAAEGTGRTKIGGFQVSDKFLDFKAARIDPLLESELGQKAVELQRDYLPWETTDPDAFSLKSSILKSIDSWGAMIPKSAGAILGNVFTAIMSFVIMLFVMFYFFRDGPAWLDRLLDFSPLDEEHEHQLLDNIKKVAKSSIMGTVLTAVAQGALGSIAFGICGIPWLFYGVLMGFCSMIPVVGTALIWIPAVVYLLLVGKTGLAIFLTIWCVVVVGMSDNFLRPFLMQGDTGMSSAILFFAILGGINLFGLIGVIYGPLIFGIFWVLLQIYNISTRAPDDDDVGGPALAAAGGGGPPPDSPPKADSRTPKTESGQAQARESSADTPGASAQLQQQPKSKSKRKRRKGRR